MRCHLVDVDDDDDDVDDDDDDDDDDEGDIIADLGLWFSEASFGFSLSSIEMGMLMLMTLEGLFSS